MATCAQCGSPLAEDAGFCGECGAKLGKGGTVPGSPITGAMRQVDLPVPVAKVAPGLPAGAPRVKGGALPEGTLIDGKYAVVRVLGQGGMGVVYLARDINTGLEVVVKAVRRELAHRSDVRSRTLDEGRVLAQIDHPNVVQLKAVVVEAQDLWLVMQYIDGESLDKTIAGYATRGERMPVSEALALMRQIAAGVGAVHQEGVIHRDLKPANVLIRRKDRVAKVTDFGIAKVPGEREQDRPQTKGIIGSLWYMSPEQVTGRRDLDARVDIYALGIVLYQMLVGEVPFDDESEYEILRMHAEAPMPRASVLRPDVTPAVDDLIQKACAKNRDQRFQTCEELCAAIDRIIAAVPPARTLPDPGPPAAAFTGPSGEVAAMASATTEQGTALPSQARAGGRRGLLYAGVGAIVAVGAVVSLIFLGVIPPRSRTKPAASYEQRPGLGPGPRPASSAAVSVPRSPLEPLTGAWVANGKDLDAVLVGDVLEFRVRTAAQFDPQNYEAGEARFVLRALAEPGTFAVEDRIRPLPPKGRTYDPRSRNTCQEVWTTAGGGPLGARFDGTRLTVELAKIEPAERNFDVEGGRVVGCKALSEIKAARVVNTLSRP